MGELSKGDHMTVQKLKKIKLEDMELDVDEVHTSVSGDELLEVTLSKGDKCYVLRLTGNGRECEAFEMI